MSVNESLRLALAFDEGVGAGDGHLLERRISVDREDEEDSVLVYREPVRAARAVGLKEFAKHVLQIWTHIQ